MAELLFKDLSQEWTDTDGGGLVRVVPVDSLRTAIVLTVKIAELAERLGHDPDLIVTNQKVTISLITHDESRVTQRDYRLAAAIDELLVGE